MPLLYTILSNVTAKRLLFQFVRFRKLFSVLEFVTKKQLEIKMTICGQLFILKLKALRLDPENYVNNAMTFA